MKEIDAEAKSLAVLVTKFIGIAFVGLLVLVGLTYFMNPRPADVAVDAAAVAPVVVAPITPDAPAAAPSSTPAMGLEPTAPPPLDVAP